MDREVKEEAAAKEKVCQGFSSHFPYFPVRKNSYI